jgi:hypothetical protein
VRHRDQPDDERSEADQPGQRDHQAVDEDVARASALSRVPEPLGGQRPLAEDRRHADAHGEGTRRSSVHARFTGC